MGSVEIEEIYAFDDESLKERLNEIFGRIISVEEIREYRYKVIYESGCKCN